MKYARLELERRYWLRHFPADLDPERGYRRIHDRYLVGTRLRLRRIESLRGETLAHKLCLKEAKPGDPPSRRAITNLYLREEEYARLATLEARVLTKRRHPYETPGGRFSVDAFEGELEGLVLAEIEFGSAVAFDAFRALPAFAEREVSDDPRFTGGALAALTADRLARLLRDTDVAAASPAPE